MPEHEPFPIRSHHLINYVQLTSAVNTKESAERTTAATNHIREQVQSLLDRQANGNDRDQEYSTDILGTQDGGAQFSTGLLKNYQQFLALPDDYPVLIQSNMPDGICASCAIGKHCATSMSEDRFVQHFVRYAKLAGVDDITIENENTKQWKVSTTAKGFRDVVTFFLQHQEQPYESRDVSDASLEWEYSLSKMQPPASED